MKKLLLICLMYALACIGARAGDGVAIVLQDNELTLTVTGDAGKIALLNDYGTVDKNSVTTLRIVGRVNEADLEKIASDFNAISGLSLQKTLIVNEEGEEDKLAMFTFDGSFPTVKALVLPSSFADGFEETLVKEKFTNAELAAVASSGSLMFAYNSVPGYLKNALEILQDWTQEEGKEAKVFDKITLIGSYGECPVGTKDAVDDLTYLRDGGLGNNRAGAATKCLDLTNGIFANYPDYEKDFEVTFGTVTSPVNGLQHLGKFATYLETLKLPQTKETTLLPPYAFYSSGETGSFSNAKEIVVPGNIENIGARAFNSCKIKSVRIERGVKNLGRGMFLGCTELVNVELPIGLQNIPPYAFSECKNLVSLDIPEGVTVIEEHAFDQTNIEGLRLPTTLKNIENDAFRQCLNIKRMVFPENLEHIGDDAFAGCTGLRNVYFLGTTTIPSCSKNAFPTTAYFSNNSCEMKDYDGEYICDDRGVWLYENQYYNRESYEGNGYCAAILHYPLVSRAAEYSSSPVSADVIQKYNEALQVDATVNLYYDGPDGSKVKLEGVPKTGVNYYTQSFKSSDEISSTNIPVNGVDSYYSDESGENKVIPNLKDDTYWYECGVDNIYSPAVYSPVDGVSVYYKLVDGMYVESPMLFGSTLYYKTGNKVTKYTATGYTKPGKSHYYKKDGNNYVIATPDFWETLYVLQDGEYVATTKFIDGVTEYYKETYSNSGVYNKIVDIISFKEQVYYEDGEEDEYLPTQQVIDGVKDYYTYNEWGTPQYSLVESISYDGAYYYVTGTKPSYCKATEFDASVKYYTKEDGGELAENVEFDKSYYYYDVVPVYTSVDDALLNNIITKLTTKLFTKSEDGIYTKLDGEASDGVDYYLMTQEACEDVYGKYYTDLERNADYRGKYYNPNNEINVTDIEKWPDKTNLSQYGGNEMGKDYPLIDGKDYSGLKNFLLVGAYKEADDPSENSTVTVIPRLDRDIWYTIYLPYSMSRLQIYRTFGTHTQLCRFLGIRKDNVASDSWTIDFSVNLLTEKDAEGNLIKGDDEPAIEANTPYMIHPSVILQEDENGNKIPVQFRAIGIAQVEKVSDKGYYGDYDKENGGKEHPKASYLPGYRFVGTYGVDNDGKTPVEVKDFLCYYFGNIWDGDNLVLQAFWSYKDEKTEGFVLNWKPYTAIIMAPDDNWEKTAEGKINVSYGVFYDDAVTSIDNVITSDEIDTEYAGKVYSINGQYVGKTLDKLAKGVYIIDGKKYIVK